MAANPDRFILNKNELVALDIPDSKCRLVLKYVGKEQAVSDIPEGSKRSTSPRSSREGDKQKEFPDILIQILSDCYEMHDIKGRRNTLVRRCFTPRLRAQVEECRDEDPMSDLCCIVEYAEKFGVLDKLIEEAIKLIDDEEAKSKLEPLRSVFWEIER